MRRVKERERKGEEGATVACRKGNSPSAAREVRMKRRRESRQRETRNAICWTDIT